MVMVVDVRSWETMNPPFIVGKWKIHGDSMHHLMDLINCTRTFGYHTVRSSLILWGYDFDGCS